MERAIDKIPVIYLDSLQKHVYIIYVVLEDFVHMSSLLSVRQPKKGAIAELRHPKPAKIRRDGRVSHEGDTG